MADRTCAESGGCVSVGGCAAVALEVKPWRIFAYREFSGCCDSQRQYGMVQVHSLTVTAHEETSREEEVFVAVKLLYDPPQLEMAINLFPPRSVLYCGLWVGRWVGCSF